MHVARTQTRDTAAEALIAAHRPSTPGEQKRAIDAYTLDRSTANRDRLIDSHYAMIVKISATFNAKGCDLDDLVQEAWIALIDAIDDFNPDRGMTFTSFVRLTLTSKLPHAINRKSNQPITGSRLARTPRGYRAVGSVGLPERSEERDEDDESYRVVEGATSLDLASDAREVDPGEAATRLSPDEIEAFVRKHAGDDRSANIFLRRSGLFDGEVESVESVADRFGISARQVKRVFAETRERLAEAAPAFGLV